MRDNSTALMRGYAPEMSFRLNLTADLSPGPLVPNVRPALYASRNSLDET